MQLLLVLLGQPLQHAVEDVVVPLVGVLVHDPRLLQQVLVHLRTLDHTVLVEVDVDVLSEPGGVVVTDSFGVTERLKDGVRLQDLLLYPGVLAGDGGEVLQDQLGALGLAGPGLPADDDALVLA